MHWPPRLQPLPRELTGPWHFLHELFANAGDRTLNVTASHGRPDATLQSLIEGPCRSEPGRQEGTAVMWMPAASLLYS